jgi:hypothetical protein
MISATLILFALLALITWRLVLTVHKWPIEEIAAPEQRRNRARVLIATRRLGIGPRPETLCDPNERAKNYLRRIVYLTGATRVGDGYMLSVGATRFHVRHRYAKRLREATDPKSRSEETCFYSKQVMPVEEQIATALLQLKNNPALFDKWAAWNGLFRANGEMFTREE